MADGEKSARCCTATTTSYARPTLPFSLPRSSLTASIKCWNARGRTTRDIPSSTPRDVRCVFFFPVFSLWRRVSAHGTKPVDKSLVRIASVCTTCDSRRRELVRGNVIFDAACFFQRYSRGYAASNGRFRGWVQADEYYFWLVKGLCRFILHDEGWLRSTVISFVLRTDRVYREEFKKKDKPRKTKKGLENKRKTKLNKRLKGKELCSNSKS